MKRSIESMTVDELRELIRADLSTDGAPSDDAIAASERLAELESAGIPEYSALAPAAQSTAKPRRTRFIIRTALVAAAAICALVIMATAGMFRNELKEDWEAAAFDLPAQQLWITHATDIDTYDQVTLEQRYTEDGLYGRLIHVSPSGLVPEGEPHVWMRPIKRTESGLFIGGGEKAITYGDTRMETKLSGEVASEVEEDAAVVYIGEPYSEEAVAACRGRKSPFDLSDSEKTLKLPVGTLDENGRYSLKIGENGVNNDSTACFNIERPGCDEMYVDSLEPWQPITFVTPEETEQDVVYSAVIYFDGRRLLIDYDYGYPPKSLADVLKDDGVDIALPTFREDCSESNVPRKSMAPDRILYHTEWTEWNTAGSTALRMDIAQYFDPSDRIALEDAASRQISEAEKYERDGITYYYLKDERGGNFRIVWQTDDCDCRIVGSIYPSEVEAIIDSMHAE